MITSLGVTGYWRPSSGHQSGEADMADPTSEIIELFIKIYTRKLFEFLNIEECLLSNDDPCAF